jgi:uncharacterized protein YcnI
VITRKLATGMIVVATAVIGWSAPAWAHVTVDPATAVQGSETTLGFRVPSEEPNADTVKVQVFFPVTHPILGVDPEPIRGWQDTVVTQQLKTPVQTDDGPVTSVVTEVDWSGGPIPPNNFVEFFVLAQSLPTGTDQLVFKVLQTYSNGDVVRWIDPVTSAQPDPPHPTPILQLTSPPSGATGGDATPTSSPSSASSGSTADPAEVATTSSVDSAKTIGLIGIVVGVLGLVVAGAALVVARRRR